MAKEEIIKEIRKLLALNQKDMDIARFLAEIGYNESEIKQLIEESKKGYAIESDLEKLRQMEGSQAEGDEENEEKKTGAAGEQEKRVSYLKSELSDLQGIIRNIKTDVGPESEKKKETTKKS